MNDILNHLLIYSTTPEQPKWCLVYNVTSTQDLFVCQSANNNNNNVLTRGLIITTVDGLGLGRQIHVDDDLIIPRFEHALPLYCS